MGSFGPSKQQKCFGTLPQICASTQSCLRALWIIPLTCGALNRQVRDFPNYLKSLEFTTGGIQSSCKNLSKMINGNRMHLSAISRLIAKGLNTYVNNVFLFLFLIHLQLSRNLFSLSHYGVLCVDC